MQFLKKFVNLFLITCHAFCNFKGSGNGTKFLSVQTIRISPQSGVDEVSLCVEIRSLMNFG